jgi:hypothetical protein
MRQRSILLYHQPHQTYQELIAPMSFQGMLARNPLELRLACWSAGVGAGLVGLSFVLHKALATLCGNMSWYRRLDTVAKKKLAGRIATIAHHTAVAGASALALWRSDEQLFEKVFWLEVGFDVADSVAACTSLSFTGMGALPVVIHHGVALAMEATYLLAPGVIHWKTAASYAMILVGSGGLDLAMVSNFSRSIWSCCISVADSLRLDEGYSADASPRVVINVPSLIDAARRVPHLPRRVVPSQERPRHL